MTDYTPDTDNLFRIYESQAAADIAKLDADLTHARRKETEAWKRGDSGRASYWESKVEKLEKKLKAAKGGEA